MGVKGISQENSTPVHFADNIASYSQIHNLLQESVSSKHDCRPRKKDAKGARWTRFKRTSTTICLSDDGSVSQRGLTVRIALLSLRMREYVQLEETLGYSHYLGGQTVRQ